MKFLQQDHDSELVHLKEGVKSKKKCLFLSYLKDAVLINQVIAEHQVNSVIDCAHRCMRESRCVSFNFEDHYTSPGHVCQINDEKKEMNFDDYVGLDGFSYFEFEVSLDNSSRCQTICTPCHEKIAVVYRDKVIIIIKYYRLSHDVVTLDLTFRLQTASLHQAMRSTD